MNTSKEIINDVQLAMKDSPSSDIVIWRKAWAKAAKKYWKKQSKKQSKGTKTKGDKCFYEGNDQSIKGNTMKNMKEVITLEMNAQLTTDWRKSIRYMELAKELQTKPEALETYEEIEDELIPVEWRDSRVDWSKYPAKENGSVVF